MSNLRRLDFEEHDGQWSITEVYADKTFRPGESFMASGHENYSKLNQVLDRIKSAYPGFRPIHIPYNKVNAARFLLEVVPERDDKD